MTYGSVPIGDDDPDKHQKAALEAKAELDSALLEQSKSSAKPLSGWLTVRRQFAPVNTSSSIFMPVTPTTPTGPTLEAQVPSIDEETAEKDDVSIKTNGSDAVPTNAQPPTTYSARIAQTYRQMVDSRQKKDAAPKEFFFCILKGSVLFLYESEEQSECVAAIGVDKYVASMENKDGGKFPGKDAEIFSKRNALVLRIDHRKKEEAKDGLPALVTGMGVEAEKELESAPWFFFSKSNTK